jgi:RND family efflux transporter MFP subunit
MIRFRRAPWIIGVLLLVLAGDIAVNAARKLTSDRNGDIVEGGALADNAIAVVAVHPAFMDWPDTIEASGAIAPWQEAIVNTQIGGYQIVELLADIGDTVEEGQTLAILNPAFLEAQREELQAKLDRAGADLKRAMALRAKGNISEKELLYAQTEERSTKALFDLKLLEIEYATVVAPDSGIVTSRSAMLGQVSQLGTELFRIIRKGRLEWRAEIAASDLTKVATGQKVEVDLPDGEVATGFVRKVAPTLDETTRRGLIYVDLIKGSEARAGMYSGGRIFIGIRQALAVPAASLLFRDGRHYVARILDAEDGPMILLLPVTVGRFANGQAEVTEGLSSSDTIVGEGAGLLDDGDRVRVLQTVSHE